MKRAQFTKMVKTSDGILKAFETWIDKTLTEEEKAQFYLLVGIVAVYPKDKLKEEFDKHIQELKAQS